MPKVFISYEFADIEGKAAALNWQSQCFKDDISYTLLVKDGSEWMPENQLWKRIKNAIDASQIVMVIVGDNAHSKPWIFKEIQYAQQNSKGIFWCNAANRTGGTPKPLSNIPATPFNCSSVQQEIRRLQIEGDRKSKY